MKKVIVLVASSISRQVVQLLNRQRRQSFADLCREQHITVVFKKRANAAVVAEIGDQSLLDKGELVFGIVSNSEKPESTVLIGLLKNDPAIGVIVDRRTWENKRARTIALVFAGAKQRDDIKANPNILDNVERCG